MPAQPRADSGGHSEKTNFITGQFKPHPTDAVTRKSRPIGATREAARCSSAVVMEGISAARFVFLMPARRADDRRIARRSLVVYRRKRLALSSRSVRFFH